MFPEVLTKRYGDVHQSCIPYIKILLKENIEDRVWKDIHLQ